MPNVLFSLAPDQPRMSSDHRPYPWGVGDPLAVDPNVRPDAPWCVLDEEHRILDRCHDVWSAHDALMRLALDRMTVPAAYDGDGNRPKHAEVLWHLPMMGRRVPVGCGTDEFHEGIPDELSFGIWGLCESASDIHTIAVARDTMVSTCKHGTYVIRPADGEVLTVKSLVGGAFEFGFASPPETARTPLAAAWRLSNAWLKNQRKEAPRVFRDVWTNLAKAGLR